MKLLFFFLCLCCGLNIAIAQDAHVSQPLMNPLGFNPAMTGYMQGRSRLSFQSRGQWWTVANKAYYKTISASFDRRFCGKKNHFAFGLQFLGNEIWDNSLSSYQMQGSAAYHLNFGSGIFGALGAQGGLLYYRLEESFLRFEDQFDPITSGFSGNASQEYFSRTKLNVWDGNIGLLVYSTDENNNFTLGFSLHHINQAQITFFEEQPYSVDGLAFKWTAYGKANFLLSPNSGIFISPTAIIQLQGNQWQGLLGLAPAIGFDSKMKQGKKVYQKKISLGAFLRLAAHYESATTIDAAILQSTFAFGNIKLTFAFDFNISSLRRASGGAGAMELGLSYQFGSEDNCTYCPEF